MTINGKGLHVLPDDFFVVVCIVNLMSGFRYLSAVKVLFYLLRGM